MKWYLRGGMITGFTLSVLIFGALFRFDVQVISIFNKEPGLIEAASAALPYFALSFVPMSLNLIFTAYFFSTKRTGRANAIAVSRGIALKALMIFCLPFIFDTGSIWIAPCATEMITLAAAIILAENRK